MAASYNENKRIKAITLLKKRGMWLFAFFMTAVCAIVFFLLWANVAADYGLMVRGEAAVSSAGLYNATRGLDKDIRGIISADSIIAEKYLAGDLSLEEAGAEIAAFNPLLRGIAVVDEGEVESAYSSRTTPSSFDSSVKKLTGELNYNDGIYFFSEAYGDTRDYMELAHVVSEDPPEKLIFVYEIDNSYAWNNINEGAFVNRFFLYDNETGTIAPRQVVLADLSKVRAELAAGNGSGYLLMPQDNKEARLISYVESGEYGYYLFNSVPVQSFQSYTVERLLRQLPSLIIFALAVFVILLAFRLTIYDPIITIEKLIDDVVNGDMAEKQIASRKNMFYPITLTINSMIQKIRSTMDSEYRANILKKQAELSMLQSQINPHFLYNTLESIRALALRAGAKDVSNMTKTLSSFFRYTIDKKVNFVSLMEELKHVEDYLTIQNYRFKNKFTYIKEFDPEDAGLMACKLSKMSLQPLVENAIFHGLEAIEGSGEIRIRILRTQKRLLIKVSDNGVGISAVQLDKLNRDLLLPVMSSDMADKYEAKNTGIAMINVNQRIKLYFGNEYGLTVYSKEGIGTDVEVVLPIVKIDGSEPEGKFMHGNN